LITISDEVSLSNITKPLCTLEFVVWDESKVAHDQFSGKASISLLELVDQQQVQRRLPLNKRTDKDHVSGDILVSVQYKYLPVRIILSGASF
jgi:hypothetical protein